MRDKNDIIEAKLRSGRTMTTTLLERTEHFEKLGQQIIYDATIARLTLNAAAYRSTREAIYLAQIKEAVRLWKKYKRNPTTC